MDTVIQSEKHHCFVQGAGTANPLSRCGMRSNMTRVRSVKRDQTTQMVMHYVNNVQLCFEMRQLWCVALLNKQRVTFGINS